MRPVRDALLPAQTLTSWIRYIVYRYHGDMEEVLHSTLRLVTLGCLITILFISGNGSPVVTWPVAPIVGFCFLAVADLEDESICKPG